MGAFAESTHLEPDAHELSVGPVANVHRAAEGNSAAARHSYPHLGNSVCDGARIHGRDRARHRDRGGPVVVGETLQGARPVSGSGECHAQDRLRADLLPLARCVALRLRHVAGDFAVHHHPDDLLGLPGHRSQQGETRADLRRQQGTDSEKGGVAGQRAHPDRRTEGERRPLAGRRRRGRIPVGESRSRLSHPVW